MWTPHTAPRVEGVVYLKRGRMEFSRVGACVLLSLLGCMRWAALQAELTVFPSPAAAAAAPVYLSVCLFVFLSVCPLWQCWPAWPERARCGLSLDRSVPEDRSLSWTHQTREVSACCRIQAVLMLTQWVCEGFDWASLVVNSNHSCLYRIKVEHVVVMTTHGTPAAGH